MAFEDFSDGAALSASSLDNLMAQTTIICTSGTRPAAPSEGWHIYETDTNKEYVYNGGWVLSQNYSASGARIGCKLVRNANQTINHSTGTNITWDTETYDPNGFIAVSSDTLTVPTGLGGIYMATLQVQWTGAPQTAGESFVSVTMDGKLFRSSSTAANSIYNCVTGLWPLASATNVTCAVFQQSTGGASLAFTQANLMLVRIAI